MSELLLLNQRYSRFDSRPGQSDRLKSAFEAILVARLAHSRSATRVVIFLTVIALSACGGGGDSGSTPPSTATNTAPQAALSVLGNVTPAVDTPLRLDARASRDADGDALTYAWTLVQRPAGSQATLANAGSALATLVPDVAGSYHVELTVADGAGHSTPALLTLQAGAGNRLVTLDHGAFRLLYDCDTHTALRYGYTLTVDTGSAARTDLFTLDDPALPAGCGQQISAASYASVATGWDRGHLATANHMDASDALIAETFHMTNIVPQRSAFNQGIWQQAETIAECYRDLAPVQVAGGVVHDDTANDFFLRSHGIRTPDGFWMALVTTDPASGATRVIAWLIPNADGLGALDAYLVSVDTLEGRVGANRVGLSGLASELKAAKPATSWALPAGCNQG